MRLTRPILIALALSLSGCVGGPRDAALVTEGVDLLVEAFDEAARDRADLRDLREQVGATAAQIKTHVREWAQ